MRRAPEVSSPFTEEETPTRPSHAAVSAGLGVKPPLVRKHSAKIRKIAVPLGAAAHVAPPRRISRPIAKPTIDETPTVRPPPPPLLERPTVAVEEPTAPPPHSPSLAPPPLPPLPEVTPTLPAPPDQSPASKPPSSSRPRWSLRVAVLAVLVGGELALAHRTGMIELPSSVAGARAMFVNATHPRGAPPH